jgi:hypothetical protein
MVDRAFLSYQPHWEWVARQFPPNQIDSYRIEGILRTTPARAGNVVILGDSTALASLDPAALGRDFAAEDLHFVPITLGGTQTVAFGLLADRLLALDPHAAILVVSAYSTRAAISYDSLNVYDVRAVPALFTLDEVVRHPQFHLLGLLGQASTIFRHRWILEQEIQVRLGMTSWGALQREQLRARLRGFRRRDFGPLVNWLRAGMPTAYPNPNTRAVSYLARRLRERGATLVLMESPAHPLMRMITAARRDDPFRDYMRALAGHEGLVYVANDELPELTLDDFADQSHLNEHGQALVTAAVAARLHDVL